MYSDLEGKNIYFKYSNEAGIVHFYVSGSRVQTQSQIMVGSILPTAFTLQNENKVPFMEVIIPGEKERDYT